MTSVLITGGAGFIGRHLALALAGSGHEVTAYDNLHPQVHAHPARTVEELRGAGVAFVEGDIGDGEGLRAAIEQAGAATVVHLAAETGTGQSYDLPAHYCEVNVTGTARLVEAVRAASAAGAPVRRMVLAGSRAVYGEGACLDAQGRPAVAVARTSEDLAAGDFAPKDAGGARLTPVPSRSATTVPAPASVYASTKLMQEYVLRQALELSGVECGILRLQNVYGVGQSLHNPYTGVLSIFAQQLLSGAGLRIFEDGEITRDFVYISDVVDAFQRLCECERLLGATLDIGSGEGVTILAVARMMIEALDLPDDRLEITGEFRPGDIRHAVADIRDAETLLGWRPKVSLGEGLGRLLAWAGDAA